MKRSMRMIAILAAGATLSTLAGGCTSATTSADSQVTLQLWMQGACATDGTCVPRQLSEAFMKANPSITIEIVPNPADSYQTTLQSASVTGSGPDIATVFGGSYLKQIGKYTADAKKWVAASDLKSSSGAEFFAENSNIANHVFAVPADNQSYIGSTTKKFYEITGSMHLRRTGSSSAQCPKS